MNRINAKRKRQLSYKIEASILPVNISILADFILRFEIKWNDRFDCGNISLCDLRFWWCFLRIASAIFSNSIVWIEDFCEKCKWRKTMTMAVIKFQCDSHENRYAFLRRHHHFFPAFKSIACDHTRDQTQANTMYFRLSHVNIVAITVTRAYTVSSCCQLLSSDATIIIESISPCTKSRRPLVNAAPIH